MAHSNLETPSAFQAADKVDCMHFQALGKAEVETQPADYAALLIYTHPFRPLPEGIPRFAGRVCHQSETPSAFFHPPGNG